MEALVIVWLSLVFGFRPATLMKVVLKDFTVGGDGLYLTEAFRKGYAEKNNLLRRLYFPWSN